MGGSSKRLAVYLNQYIDGIVSDAPEILERSSVDRSILRYKPILYARPLHALDIQKLLRFSSQLAVKNTRFPITVRTSGLSQTGDDLGSGLVLDLSHFNKIQEFDARQKLIRVQSGATLGAVKNFLRLQGFELNVAGDERETFSDLYARGALATHGNRAADFAELIEHCELLLPDGSLHVASKIATKKKNTLKIHQDLRKILLKNAATIRAISSHDRSGYPGLKKQGEKSLNLATLFAGANNSLAVPVEFIVKVEASYEQSCKVAVICRNASELISASKSLKALKFTDILAYDAEFFNATEYTGKKSNFVRRISDDAFILIASAKDDSLLRQRSKLQKLRNKLKKSQRIVVEDDENRLDFQLLESAMQAYWHQKRGKASFLPLADGVYIPEAHQKDFLDKIAAFSKEQKIASAIFAQLDFDVFTLRPSVDLSKKDGRSRAVLFLREYYNLVKSCGGYLCGASSDGRLLGFFVTQDYSEERKLLQKDIKKLFDPHDILCPGIKHDASARDIASHMRDDYVDLLA